MIISGSADAKLKIWVKDFNAQNQNMICSQTLVDHSGTILSVSVSSQTNIIATSSTD